MPLSSLRTGVAFCLLAGMATAPTLAAPVHHEGTAEAAEPLRTYGMRVASTLALRDVLPAGWEVSRSAGTELSGEVSWSPNDTWVAVVERIAARNTSVIRVDWNAQTVLVGPGGVGTNASSLVSEPPALELPQEAEEQSREWAPRAFNRTPLREPLEVLADRHGLTLIYEAGQVSLPGPLTLMLGDSLKADIELLNRALGPVRHLDVLRYEKERELVVRTAPVNAFLSLPGRPQIQEHRGLLARLFDRDRATPMSAPGTSTSGTGALVVADAAANSEPVFAANWPELSVDDAVLEDRDDSSGETFAVDVPDNAENVADISQEPAAPDTDAEEALPTDALLVEAPSPDPVDLFEAAPVLEPAPVAGPASIEGPVSVDEPPLEFYAAEFLVLTLAQGERLSQALEQLLSERGWALIWRAELDLEAATPTRIEGHSLAHILEQVLPQLGLAADLYNPSRTAVIRTAEASAIQGAP